MMELPPSGSMRVRTERASFDSRSLSEKVWRSEAEGDRKGFSHKAGEHCGDLAAASFAKKVHRLSAKSSTTPRDVSPPQQRVRTVVPSEIIALAGNLYRPHFPEGRSEYCLPESGAHACF